MDSPFTLHLTQRVPSSFLVPLANSSGAGLDSGHVSTTYRDSKNNPIPQTLNNKKILCKLSFDLINQHPMTSNTAVSPQLRHMMKLIPSF